LLYSVVFDAAAGAPGVAPGVPGVEGTDNKGTLD
jgi:hypothetical protein